MSLKLLHDLMMRPGLAQQPQEAREEGQDDAALHMGRRVAVASAEVGERLICPIPCRARAFHGSLAPAAPPRCLAASLPSSRVPLLPLLRRLGLPPPLSMRGVAPGPLEGRADNEGRNGNTQDALLHAEDRHATQLVLPSL